MFSAAETGAPAHAARMDAIYRGQRHIYDLTRKYYLLGRDQAIAGLGLEAGGAVLEIGCGTARNLARIARRYPRAEVCGIDISREMLASAAATLRRTGLSRRVRLAQADATGFDARAAFGRAGFDRVLFSYTLSMIPDWQGAIDHALSLLAPGGRLVIVDFGDQHGLPRWFRAGLRRWLARFAVTPRDGLPGVLARHAEARGMAAQVAFAWRGYALIAEVRRR